AVQFNHRLLAYAVVAAILCLWIAAWRAGFSGRARLPADLLLAMVVVQLLLGIATVVSAVPLGLGVAHQAGAIAVFCLSLWTAYVLRRQLR
ncbi:MAG: COX15/CtaA family protein, partial [Pseudomonadota bacterium]